MNVTVQHRHGSKSLQGRQCACAVVRPPPPLGVDRPERNMRKHDDRRAALQLRDVLLEPLELLVAKVPESTRFEVDHIDQPDEVHTVLVEAVPPRALRSLAKPRQVAPPVVLQDVVLAGNIEDGY